MTTIETPQQLGKALKDYFKSNFNIEIRTRYIKTVRGLINSWYEISTFRTNSIIPNDFRKEIVNMFLPDAKISNLDDINYGNIGRQSVSVYGKHWIEFLNKKENEKTGLNK